MTPWLLAIALHVGASELTVGLRNEDRIGSVPLITNQSGSAAQQLGAGTTLSFEVIPSVTYRLRTRVNELQVQAQSQLMLTRAFGTSRTLGLHSGGFRYSHAFTRTLSLYTTANGTFGNLDFYRARRQLSPDTPTIISIPENQVLGYSSANAYFGLRYELMRFWQIDAGAIASHTGPSLGQQSLTYFRKQDSAGASARLSHQLGRFDAVGVMGEYRWVWFEGGPYYQAAQPELFWRHRFSRTFGFDFHAGVLISGTRYGRLQTRDWVLGEGLLPRRIGTERRYLPVFGLSLASLEVRGNGITWTSTFTANLLPYYDPVQGVLQQRIAVGSRNLLTLSRTSSLRIELQVYVPSNAEFGPASKQPYVDQDVFAILNPVYVRRLDPMINLELGALVTQRLEDYTQVFGSWYRPEMVFYVALVGRTKVW